MALNWSVKWPGEEHQVKQFVIPRSFLPFKIQDIVFLTQGFLIPFSFPKGEKTLRADLAPLVSFFSKCFLWA